METYFRFQLALRRQIHSIGGDFRPDIVLVNHAEMPDLLCRHTSLPAPFVVIAHTTLRTQLRAAMVGRAKHNILDSSEKTVAAFAPLLLSSEAVYWRRTRHAVFVSKAIRCAIEGAFGPRLRHSSVIPNGIDTSLFMQDARPIDAHEPGGDPPRILFVGRLLAAKGLAVLFSALRQINDLGWNCLVVGPGNLNHWRAQAVGFDISSRTRVIGPLPRALVLSIMKESSVFVLPSFWESCPYTLLEAMGSGLPVIASRVGDVPEILQDRGSGLLFEAGDSYGLAKGLRTILTEDGMARQMGERGKAIIERRFTARDMGFRTIEALEQILTQP